MMIRVAQAEEEDLGELTRLAKILWPEETDHDLQTTFKETFYRPNEISIKALDGDKMVGIAIFSIRSEYVEGSEASPTGYLEAIIVDESARGKGVANALLENGIEWCKGRGCRQLGSDVELDNEVSQAFHQKSGFREVNRLVCYIREI